MCLDTFSSMPPPPTGRGFKVFEQNHDGSLSGQYYNRTVKYPIDEWIAPFVYSSGQRPKVSGKAGIYEAGFHIFSNLVEAMEWQTAIRSSLAPWGVAPYVIREVEYRGAYVFGTQVVYDPRGDIPLTVIVADEIKILPLDKPDQA